MLEEADGWLGDIEGLNGLDGKTSTEHAHLVRICEHAAADSTASASIVGLGIDQPHCTVTGLLGDLILSVAEASAFNVADVVVVLVTADGFIFSEELNA